MHDSPPGPSIPYYLDYLSSALLERLQAEAEPVPGVAGLRVAPGLRSAFPAIESAEALSLVCEVYSSVREELREVLEQRRIDRAFIDATTRECTVRNAGRPFLSADYETVIGARDASGRVVVGPDPVRSQRTVPFQRVSIPVFLRGEQVTLFGPPDTRKMSINAMNALHRRLPDEPSIVAELVEASGQVPRWGADDEDSKTPIMRSFLLACENLIGCFEGDLSLEEPGGRHYALAPDRRSLPIKRIPGLALPDGSHLLDGQPIPFHLFDLCQHLYHNRRHEQARVFYVPKLETPEEARYLKRLIEATQAAIGQRDSSYVPGAVGLFIVFESPRSIFRIQEIAEALHPHFLGGSLGWHDFLASTARLFRYDPHYRIPVKADPNIVINHIKESHLILARSLRPLGALKLGGMYGVLYEDGNPASFEVSMVGYVKDVVTQLKRGLDGFWVAHPSFVRVGMALVQAWRQGERDPGDTALRSLISALVPNPTELGPLLAFVFGPDVPGLEESDPLYLRGVLAADIELSEVIANHDPEEVRYNVFQALQYLADWLRGNGCVALPATMTNAAGEKVFVRIMDDLATTERSRWELWAEVYHGRVSQRLFDQILQEELDFIRRGEPTDTRRIQVRWEGEAAQWYPIAGRLLHQLVTDPDPVEFVTELLLPFTLEPVRNSADPWRAARMLCPGRYHAPTRIWSHG